MFSEGTDKSVIAVDVIKLMWDYHTEEPRSLEMTKQGKKKIETTDGHVTFKRPK